MSRNEIIIQVEPEDLYAVFLDAQTYPKWVVGARRIRAVDPEWPTPGSAFHHESWLGLMPVQDRTIMMDCEPGKSVHLNAGIRPAGTADVLLTMEPHELGTKLVIEERAVTGPWAIVWNKAFDAGMWVRNEESLRRLKRYVEQRQNASSDSCEQ